MNKKEIITRIRVQEEEISRKRMAVLERISPGKQLGDHDWNVSTGKCNLCDRKFYKKNY